jgi:hypothetical protein
VANADELSAEIQELTWAMVDDEATDEQVRHLGEMLAEDPEARRIYIMCMQMHADLHYLFGKRPQLPAEVQKAIDASKVKKTNRQPTKNDDNDNRRGPTGRRAPTTAPLPLVDLSHITVNGSPAFYP